MSDGFDDELHEFGPVRDVVICGHRRDAELVRELTHGEAVESDLAGEEQRGADDVDTRDRRWTPRTSGHHRGPFARERIDMTAQ